MKKTAPEKLFKKHGKKIQQISTKMKTVQHSKKNF